MKITREQFLKNVKAEQRKEIVTKSASPPMARLRNGLGEVVGTGPVERLTHSQVERLLVAKSVGDSDGLGGGLGNEIFNDLFSFDPPMQAQEEIAKSADDELNSLDAMFPLWLQTN